MSLPEFFVSCDWGTSSFRLRLIDLESGRAAAGLTADQGVRALNDSLSSNADRHARETAFADFLGMRLDDLLKSHSKAAASRVVLSGMASSTIGWRELPYSPSPLHLDGSNLVHERIPVTTPSGRDFELILISGAQCENDIMRGEETELIGLLNHPDYTTFANDSLVLLPGTHSKHVRLRHGRIESWRTFMTGELFEALTSATILRQTTEARADDAAESKQDFREGAAEGFDPGMEQGLFHARARSVLNGKSSSANREFLSGLLIGSELRHAVDHANGRPLLIGGSARLSDRYRNALEIVAEATADSPSLQVAPVNLPEGAASVLGHSFLLKQWSANGDNAPT